MGKDSKKRLLALVFAAIVVLALFILTLSLFSASKSDGHRSVLVIGAVLLAWAEIEIVIAIFGGGQ